MNEFLADMYGTRETIGAPSQDTDVEKLAEVQLLDEALQAEGIDIDQLPGETILKLAYQILGEDSHLVKAAMEEGEGEETPAEEKKEEKKEEGEESMEEKVAQADFLGRVMAHSYVNELNDIEKSGAAIGTETAKKFMSSVARARDAARQAKAYAGSAKAGRGFSGGKSMGSAEGKLHEMLFKGKAKAKSLAKKTKKHVGEHKGKYLAGGGVAAGGAAGFAAGKKKAASAIDELAEKRAMQWAEEVGLFEDTSEEEKLAAAVDARAYEMLTAEGIDVDAIEAALQEE